jgi:hypothetical protein
MEIIIKDETVNRIIFHFNKFSLQDTSIPMWVIKHKGKTYYVNHVISEVGWHTKETPENEATKGSIQFRGKLEITNNGTETEARIYS